MPIEFDAAKRQRVIEKHGLDLADAGAVFDGPTVTVEDSRRTYSELRMVTVGHLRGRLVIVVWTPRGEATRVISMRKANERERNAYAGRL